MSIEAVLAALTRELIRGGLGATEASTEREYGLLSPVTRRTSDPPKGEGGVYIGRIPRFWCVQLLTFSRAYDVVHLDDRLHVDHRHNHIRCMLLALQRVSCDGYTPVHLNIEFPIDDDNRHKPEEVLVWRPCRRTEGGSDDDEQAPTRDSNSL